MADPELDHDDTHLTRALDELARLVDAPVQDVVSFKSTRSESEENEVENQIPQPLPEPIPIEVPLPPTPVIVQPPTNASLTPATENSVIGDRGLLAELSSLSAGTRDLDASTRDRASPEPSKASRRKPDLSPLMVSAVVLSTFVAGMLTERFARVLENLRGRNAPANGLADRSIADNELTGRITYKTKEGESQPDRGARILVFPQTRSGQVKLSVVGFRPADEPADQSVANAALQALGGAAATVDSDGKYRLPIEAGTYRLLIVSHFQPRDDSPVDPELEKLLALYFENPDELLGRVQHQFSPLRIKGSGDVWDQSF